MVLQWFKNYKALPCRAEELRTLLVNGPPDVNRDRIKGDLDTFKKSLLIFDKNLKN